MSLHFIDYEALIRLRIPLLYISVTHVGKLEQDNAHMESLVDDGWFIN